MSVSSIRNYIKVSDDIASSGQPGENQFQYIARAKYNVVINLAMPDSDNAIPEEGSIVTTLGMQYVHIPVPFNFPEPRHLKTFFKIMDAYAGQKAWVHCVLNYRVSAFLYLWQRLVKGETHEQAKKAMLPAWEPNEIWSAFMKLSANDIEN